MNTSIKEALAELEADQLEALEQALGPLAAAEPRQVADTILAGEHDQATLASCIWLLSHFDGDEQKARVLPLLALSDEREIASEFSRLAVSMKVPQTAALAAVLTTADAPYEARVAAAHALGYSYDEEAVPAVIAVACNRDEKEELRGFAVETLGMLGFASAIEPLAQIAEEGHPELNFWVAYALGEIGSSDGLPTLRKLAEDPRTAAGWGKVSDEAKQSLDRIESLQHEANGATKTS